MEMMVTARMGSPPSSMMLEKDATPPVTPLCSSSGLTLSNPRVMHATIGTMNRPTSIRRPWIKSVSQTAMKPPRKV